MLSRPIPSEEMTHVQVLVGALAVLALAWPAVAQVTPFPRSWW